LSEKTGFGYEEMLRMPAHFLLGLWNQKKAVFEERSKEQEKQQGKNGGSISGSMPSMSGMQSQARSMMSGMKSSMTPARLR
jgi:hypothetical protein